MVTMTWVFFWFAVVVTASGSAFAAYWIGMAKGSREALDTVRRIRRMERERSGR